VQVIDSEKLKTRKNSQPVGGAGWGCLKVSFMCFFFFFWHRQTDEIDKLSAVVEAGMVSLCFFNRVLAKAVGCSDHAFVAYL